MKLCIFVGILQVLKFDFLKFRVLEILNFHPWDCMGESIREYSWIQDFAADGP